MNDANQKIVSLLNKNNHHLWFNVENFYAQTYDQFNMKRHSHNRIEIMYAASGSCIIDVLLNGEWESYTLYSGEFVFIDAGIPHSLTIKEDQTSRMLNVELSLVPCNNFMNLTINKLKSHFESFQKFLKMNNGFYKITDNGSVQKCIMAIHHEFYINEENSEKEFMFSLLIAQIFVEISRCAFKDYKITTGYTYVKKAISYIEKNFCSDIKMEDLACEVDIHVGYLHRLFKQNVGMTVVNYINSLRIRRACIMIENSNRSLNDIYYEVGFKNRQHFTHTFKAVMGVTPTEYKKKIMNAEIIHCNQDPSTNILQQDE